MCIFSKLYWSDICVQYVLTSIKGPEVSLEAVLEEASERLAV